MSKIIHHPEVKNEFSDCLKVHLLKALESDPKFAEAHFQLALIYQEDGDYKTAETYFWEAIESDSKQISEIEKQVEKLLEKFQFQNAKILFMKAQTKKHHCAESHFQLSNLYENQKKNNQSANMPPK